MVTESTWGSPKVVNISTDKLINGSYAPKYCRPAFSVAILVPYRNRKEHLNIFLPNIHNFLKMQNIHYKVYLIEQQDEHPWNKGILFNVGAKQAIADGFPCLILHDVDLLPLDHSNLYACTIQPRHMSSCIDEFRFVLLYDIIFGGVVSIRSDQYKTVNGFSNKFDYWGGEDDEFLERIFENGLKMQRFPPDMSRYTLLHGHAPRVDNKNRWIIRAENRRTRRRGDGLDSVQKHVLKVTVEGHPMYTLLGVKRNYSIT
ncbi:beta-1,4-N-acetylgalactosaminyltransferase bre-4-like [Pectinophora gossypiella]|uniref:beta-1,4-N-acetylgalactosaminyltransferase bre-4-like n=1 Tax=Pectinophora gossypiella TaxID=13191 RepID=UPI00214EE4A9|nr:beta-1,4-N-acetylgalactosaminyltransferase bre-4-like [Pectinophora gossypiella]